MHKNDFISKLVLIQIFSSSGYIALSLPVTHMKLPATGIYPHITKLIFDEWQEVWDCCAGNKLHAIRPTVGYYKQKTGLSRRDTVLLNRLRIGHTRLTHSYLLSGDDLPSCPDVPLRNYTLTHSVALVDSLIVFSSVFSCTPLITLSILGFVASCCLRVSRVWQ